MGICPAANDTVSNGINGGHNGGRICWAIAGTYCFGKKQGTYAKKSLTCVACDFYLKVNKEEGRSFILLKPGQDFREWKKALEKLKIS